MWIQGLLSRPPASSSSTRQRPDSLSRPATAQPADPAPVTIKSKVSPAIVIRLPQDAHETITNPAGIVKCGKLHESIAGIEASCCLIAQMWTQTFFLTVDSALLFLRRAFS